MPINIPNQSQSFFPIIYDDTQTLQPLIFCIVYCQISQGNTVMLVAYHLCAFACLYMILLRLNFFLKKTQ